MLLLYSFFRLKQFFQVKNGLTTSSLFLLKLPKSWVGTQGGGGGGVMNSPIAPIGIARRMILAIVTSREIYPGNFKWFHRAKLFRGVKG